jgi:hypothetical protein
MTDDKVQRLSMGVFGERESEEGAYVLYADYAKLEAELSSSLAANREKAAETERLKARMLELARMFNIPDGGHYLNDWIGRKDELSSLRASEKWIEIKESCELPEHGQDVICVCDWGVCFARCYVDFDNRLKFGNVKPGCFSSPNVTHWQPLPAPPIPTY